MRSLFPRDVDQQARRIIEAYTHAGLTLVTAESCTGGLIAAALTDIPGSSAVMERGFVTYSNEAKAEAIGVDAALIAKHGAVSAEVASAMATGALAHSRADIAISVTGIAGPDGGSPEKPVGLVYLAIARKGEEPEICRCLFENMDRGAVRLSSVTTALTMVEKAVAN